MEDSKATPATTNTCCWRVRHLELIQVKKPKASTAHATRKNPDTKTAQPLSPMESPTARLISKSINQARMAAQINVRSIRLFIAEL